MRRPWGSGASRGFSLLEVVIAAALLLMTVSATTAVVSGATRGDARISHAAEVDRALRLEVERLRALPFCAFGSPVGSPVADPGGEDAWNHSADAVSELFPHAQPARNTERDHFVGAGDTAGEPVGSFVTRRVRDGVTVVRVAWFASRDGAVLPAASVTGWAVSEDGSPPEATLVVRLTAEREGHHRTTGVVLRALSSGPGSGEPAASDAD